MGEECRCSLPEANREKFDSLALKVNKLEVTLDYVNSTLGDLKESDMQTAKEIKKFNDQYSKFMGGVWVAGFIFTALNFALIHGSKIYAAVSTVK